MAFHMKSEIRTAQNGIPDRSAAFGGVPAPAGQRGPLRPAAAHGGRRGKARETHSHRRRSGRGSPRALGLASGCAAAGRGARVQDRAGPAARCGAECDATARLAAGGDDGRAAQREGAAILEDHG